MTKCHIEFGHTSLFDCWLIPWYKHKNKHHRVGKISLWGDNTWHLAIRVLKLCLCCPHFANVKNKWQRWEEKSSLMWNGNHSWAQLPFSHYHPWRCAAPKYSHVSLMNFWKGVSWLHCCLGLFTVWILVTWAYSIPVDDQMSSIPETKEGTADTTDTKINYIEVK